MSGSISYRNRTGFVEEGVQVSLDHELEALFLLLVHLVTYLVDGPVDVGRASLRRTSNVVERFRVVAQGLRTFHVQNAQVSASAQFRVKFVQF